MSHHHVFFNFQGNAVFAVLAFLGSELWKASPRSRRGPHRHRKEA
jgi:hypothetical protein